MSGLDTTAPDDLTGTADERMRQLNALAGATLSAEWLRRQLDAVLLAWADDETELDIEKDFRTDY